VTDFFPSLLHFPLFLVFLSFLCCVFLFLQTPPLLLNRRPCPIARHRAAHRPFFTLPHWSVFGLVEVHGYGFLKTRYVSLCQRHPFMRPSTMQLPSSHSPVIVSLPCTCVWISLSRECPPCAGAWPCDSGLYHFPLLLLLFTRFLLLPSCFSFVISQPVMFLADFVFCGLLSSRFFIGLIF
jgi:hypothetical protein